MQLKSYPLSAPIATAAFRPIRDIRQAFYAALFDSKADISYEGVLTSGQKRIDANSIRPRLTNYCLNDIVIKLSRNLLTNSFR